MSDYAALALAVNALARDDIDTKGDRVMDKQTSINETSASFGLGLSPCPNDTFIFHALLSGLLCGKDALPPDLRPRPHFADVEELNEQARQGRLEVTKLSVGAVPFIMHDYLLLSAGAALGWGCGPLLVARADWDGEPGTARIAVPGLMTTANLLLNLEGSYNGPREAMLFSDVMPAVAEGRAELGVIIHEGRFTYQKFGLRKVLDLGQWWESAYHVPLPLGVIAARRDLPEGKIMAIQAAIAASLRHAWARPEDSRAFVRSHAQELDEKVTGEHIRTFVTEYSLELGETGRAAISLLVERAAGLAGITMPERLFA